MSEERIEWNIEECIQVIENLNTNGTLIKNAIAGIYNTFRYKISNEWSGHNYNIVVRELNGCAPEFRSITTYLGVTVPSAMQEIVNAQAENGQGYARTIALGSDNENPDIWEVQESVETADGSTRINLEALRPYITGSEYPSVTAAIDLAKQYFQDYLNVFEQNISTFQNNPAIMEAYQKVQDYRSQFESRTTTLVEDIVAAAESGIQKIEETDITTRRTAQNATEGASNGSQPGTGSDAAGTGAASEGSSGSNSSGYVSGGSSSNSSGYVSGGSSSNSTGSSLSGSTDKPSGGASSNSSGYVSGGSSSNSTGSSSSKYAKSYVASGETSKSSGEYHYSDSYGDYRGRDDGNGGYYKEYKNGNTVHIDYIGDAHLIDKNGNKYDLSADGTYTDSNGNKQSFFDK